MVDLSIILPVHNEEENLISLYERLTAILQKLNLSYEIIFVDDGSTDSSAKIITDLNQKDSKVKLLCFSRNFGHMVALSAGLDYAQGKAVITMDADLQHPPELIPKLVEKWKEGNEIVNTLRKETKGVGILKIYSAGVFYWLINKITKINLPANAADFRLLDRKVVEALKQIHERSRFLRGIISWIGYKQEFIEYEAAPRLKGKTKYSLGKMIAFALDGITSFSSFPLRLSTYFGLLVALLSFIYILYAIYIRIFTNQAIPGWTSVLVTVLFIGGVQLIFLGIIGEYLSRVYEETKQRPLYLVSKKVGF